MEEEVEEGDAFMESHFAWLMLNRVHSMENLTDKGCTVEGGAGRECQKICLIDLKR